MDNSKQADNYLSEDYLGNSQLTELIGGIEQCANRLADAAKKAKLKFEKLLDKPKPSEPSL